MRTGGEQPPHPAVRIAVATELAPFRAWRYAADIPLDEVLIPPYDVIDEQQQAAFYRRHPHNVIRLVLGRTYPDDTPTRNQYTRAAATLRTWQRLGIFTQDAEPSYYVLRQTFTAPDGSSISRVGVIGRFRLQPWGQGILPHEQTFPTAKADRMALLKATGMHFSPIFALYSDPEHEVASLLAQVVAGPPVAVFHDDAGVRHEVWRVWDPSLVRGMHRAFSGRTFYVADGHHRYETALAFRRWMRERHPDAPPGQPYDFALMYVAAMEDPGVTILPTHRALRGRPDVTPERVLAAARRAYAVEPIGDDEALLRWIASVAPGMPDLALIFPTGPAYRLRLRLDSHPAQRMLAEVPRPIADLAVYHLQRFILGPGAGVGESPSEQKRVLAFRPDTRQLVQEVRAGLWNLVALVAPTSLAQLRAIADAGLVAPPKATYFYPKLPSGLVMYAAREP